MIISSSPSTPLSPIETYFNPSQPLNALEPIDVTFLGIISSFKDTQSQNA